MEEKSEKIWKIRKKIVKRFGKYGRKVSWIVKWYEKKGRKASRIAIRYAKYRRKLWNDMEERQVK
jgi:hypothetical protein